METVRIIGLGSGIRDGKKSNPGSSTLSLIYKFVKLEPYWIRT
jgi:hypothetical protein